jgi:hypothetical protein
VAQGWRRFLSFLVEHEGELREVPGEAKVTVPRYDVGIRRPSQGEETKQEGDVTWRGRSSPQ